MFISYVSPTYVCTGTRCILALTYRLSLLIPARLKLRTLQLPSDDARGRGSDSTKLARRQAAAWSGSGVAGSNYLGNKRQPPVGRSPSEGVPDCLALQLEELGGEFEGDLADGLVWVLLHLLEVVEVVAV